MNSAIYLSFGIKLIRSVLSYIAVAISTNYTTQIYIDKVLVNQENPPHLSNMLYLYMFIEFSMYAILCTIVYLMLSANIIPKDLIKETDVMKMILIDYVIHLAITMAFLSNIASIMYSRKYYLYKDDGLRAIRAFGSMIVNISIVSNLIPYNFLVDGIVSHISSTK